MGWVDSLPYFCAATETVADLVDTHVNWDTPPRHLDADAATPPDPNGTAIVPASWAPTLFPASIPEPTPWLQ
jgi:hypothetical protein